MMSEEFRNNKEAQRYELAVDGQLAIATYERRGNIVAIPHTRVPPALEGRGIAGRLIAAALADIRGQGLKVLPLCSYVSHYMKKHPEALDLLARPLE